MANDFRFDDRGFIQKFRALQAAGDYFLNIHLDAATFLQEKLVTEVINGQYVNVISGNLRRSQAVIPVTKFKTILASDLTVAPYAVFVLDWSRREYSGRTFLQITLDLFLTETKRRMKSEYKRMIRSVNFKRSYKYQNPF